MKERRKFNRIKSPSTAILEEKNRLKESTLLDIGPGGMKILLDNDIEVGSAISGRFKIMPNAGGSFYVQGEVVWVKPVKEKSKPPSFAIGIKFCKVSTIPL